MRMRLGALLAAVTGLVAQAQLATAGHCGAANYSSCPQPVCDAQVSFPSCQQQAQPACRLVYENVMETRYRTCYQTVQETVMKPVCKTCYREEARTTFKTCKETCYREVRCPVTKQVQVTCYKDVPVTVCKPVTVQKVQHVKAQVAKQICEQGVRTVCDPVCKTVQKVCYRDVGPAQVCRPGPEGCQTVYKDVCTTCYKDVVETQYRCEKRKVCKPVTYMKTVTHKCNEWVEEQYTVPGKKIRCKEEVRDVECDPCASSCNGCDDGHKCGRWKTCRSWTYTTPCETKCRKVCKTRKWCEQVPCTKMVTETVTEKVPYQVCKRVPVTTTQKVPCEVKCMGAWVDDKGCGHEAEGPGRCWKDGATYRKQVPYTVCEQVTEMVKREIPYSNVRCARGAYVDEKGCAHECEGPGRKFVEGACFEKTVTTCETKNIQETIIKKVPYCTTQCVTEECVKRVPYTVCKQVPVTTMCKVPYTVTEQVPTTVCKKVKVCVPEQVCVRKARQVPCEPPCAPACQPAPSCAPAVVCQPACPPKCDAGCGHGGKSTYQESRVTCKELGFFRGLFHRSSGCETGGCNGK